MVWLGLVRRGWAGLGRVRWGSVRLGEGVYGPSNHKSWRGAVGQGRAWRGQVWLGLAGCG